MIRKLSAGITLALIAAACGGSSAPATTAQPAPDTTMHMDEHTDFEFGEPAEAAEADRVIEIMAGDDLKFDPAEIMVKAGETVTFRIQNTGALPHDFTLGDEPMQEEHEAEMAEMSGAMEHADPNAVLVPAGETVELTWHFTEPGTILAGCHQTGHYAAGMKGTITIEA